MIRCPMHPRGVDIPAVAKYVTIGYCVPCLLLMAGPERKEIVLKVAKAFEARP